MFRDAPVTNEAAVASGSAEVVDAGERPVRILRLPEVCQVTGLKRAMIYRLQQKKSFPQSVKITDHAVGWIDVEVQAWLEQRIAARGGSAREKKGSR
jgi:prophage regulatory protein